MDKDTKNGNPGGGHEAFEVDDHVAINNWAIAAQLQHCVLSRVLYGDPYLVVFSPPPRGLASNATSVKCQVAVGNGGIVPRGYGAHLP